MKVSDLRDAGISDSSLRFSISTKQIEVDSNEKVTILLDSFYDILFFKLYDKKEKFKEFLESIKNNKTKSYYDLLYAILFLSLDDVKIKLDDVDYNKPSLSVFRSIVYGETLKKTAYSKYSEYLAPLISIVDSYIKERKSVLGANIIKSIFPYDDNLYLRVLYQLCLKMDGELEYVVDPTIYRSEVVLAKYQAFERELLFYLDTNQLDKAGYFTDMLVDIYDDSLVSFFAVVSLFLAEIGKMRLNKRYIGNHVEYGVIGNVDSVLIRLLSEGDFYRVREVVMEHFTWNSNDIKYIIYKKLVDILFKSMRYNTEVLFYQFDLCAVDESSIEDIIGMFSVRSIPLETFQSFEEKKDEWEPNVNYYHRYEEHLKRGELKEALTAIKRFQLMMRKNGNNVLFDYIERDLTMQINMYKCSDNDMESYNKYIKLGEECYNNWDYRKAIFYYLKAQKAVKNIPSSIMARIANCYYNIGNIDSAICYYNKAARGLLYPSEILVFIECLFIKKQYRRVIDWVEIYEKYHVLENARIHYIASIAEAHLRNYSAALSELEITEMIIKSKYGVVYQFNYERDILAKMEVDKSISCYTLDTFVDFELNEYEKQMKEKFLEYLEVITDPVGSILLSIDDDKDSFEEKMEYLFSLLKVLIMNNRHEEAKKVYDFIETLLAKSSANSAIVSHFTLNLKNYKNL